MSFEREQIQEHEFNNDISEAVNEAFEVANSSGFSLEGSLASDHPELDENGLKERVDQVSRTMTGMSEAIGLDSDFFKDLSNTILFSAIADSWIDLEESATNGDNHLRNSREREMLQDAALIFAGPKSSFVRNLGPGISRGMYLSIEEDDSDLVKERSLFLDSITDPELSERVQSVLGDYSEGSFLASQREKLGIDADNEEPFKVQVISIGSRWDLTRTGLLPKMPNVPMAQPGETEEDRVARQKQGEAFDEWREVSDRVAGPMEQASKDYDEKFQDEFGPLVPAMVSIDRDGTKKLMIRSTEARVLVAAQSGEELALDDDDLQREMAIIKHEYAHTQKSLLKGEHIQAGLLLEERKAELVSGDRQGYQDVKYFINDLSMTHDVSILTILDESLKKPDALSAALSALSTEIGLRNTLMLMVGKPIPYESDPSAQKYFPDTRCLRKTGDASDLDAVLRQQMEGVSPELLKSRVASRVAKLALDKLDAKFLTTQYVAYKKGHGINRLNDHFVAAINDRAASE